MKNRSWPVPPLIVIAGAATVILTLCVLSFVGCGSTTDSEAMLTGIFLDNVVEGMRYKCGDRTGYTDSEGKFYFKEGETVYFSIGGLPIGQTDEAQYLTTPIHLVDADNSFVLHPAVSNICRLLQSLDDDGDPTNGILITKETRDRIQALVDGGLTSLNFNQDEISFTTEVLNSGLFSSADDIVSKKTANSHLFNTMAKKLLTPVMMINLGDSLTAGAQSGIGNILINTQGYGYPGIIANQMLYISYEDFEHNIPLLYVVSPGSDLDVDNYYTQANGFKKRLYRGVYDEDAADDEIMTGRYLTPYNLAVPGATISSVRNTLTTPPAQSPPEENDNNDIMTDLYLPIPELKAKHEIEDVGGDYNGTDRSEVTQLEAALFLANQEEQQHKLKIFTLWIGAEDTLGVITQNMGSDLTMTNITQFLNDHANYQVDLQYIVDELKAVEYAYVFIATIPKVETLGILFSKEDIIKMAHPAYGYEPDLTDSGMGTELIGFKPFVGDYINPDPDDPTNPSISRCLGNSENEELLNDNIEQVLDTDANYLDQTEIDLINARIDEMNTFIKSLASDNVIVVDVSEEIYEKAASEDGFDIIDELARDKDRIPTHEDYLDNWGEYGIDPVLTKTMAGGFYSLDGYHPSYTGYGTIGFLFMNKIVEAGIGLDTMAKFEFDGEEYDALSMEITDIQIGDLFAQDEDEDGFIYALPAASSFSYHFYDAVTMGGWVDCGKSDETILPYFVGGLQGDATDPDALYDSDLDVTYIDFYDCMGYMPAYTE